MATSHEKTYEVYNGVSEQDVPSAKWGWSELSPKTIQLAGWGSVIFLVAYNFGNHEGHVETIWLLSIAAIIAIGLILFALRPQLSQVRTLTGANQPVGYQEKDWDYDQKTLSGEYATLTDSQLRALNIDPARVAHLRELDNGSTAAKPVEANTTRVDRSGSTVADEK
ncbi:DUF2631 domain-containing protein [Corynebacterium pilosum]|uniref:Hypothetical membrane protein n=1 Tax=Corynebacterium pilosum TaxID=35756 RepID=A0A376CIK3_9CORY|nr:DUF2631 domain-containing protein [Corynebacterium pilosum]STC68125.1 hypothetical membrane protein [Corynebacterium pilosum]